MSKEPAAKRSKLQKSADRHATLQWILEGNKNEAQDCRPTAAAECNPQTTLQGNACPEGTSPTLEQNSRGELDRQGGCAGGGNSTSDWAGLLAEAQVCSEEGDHPDEEGGSAGRANLAVTARALQTERNYLALKKLQIMLEYQRLVSLYHMPQADMLRLGQSLQELDKIRKSGSLKASLPEVLQHVQVVADIQLGREGPIAMFVGKEAAKRIWKDVQLQPGWNEASYRAGRVSIATAFAAGAGNSAATKEVMELSGPGRFSGKGVVLGDMMNLTPRGYWQIRDEYVSEIHRLTAADFQGRDGGFAERRAARLAHELLIICRLYAIPRPFELTKHLRTMWSNEPVAATAATKPLQGLGGSLPLDKCQRAKLDSFCAVHARAHAEFVQQQEALRKRVDECLSQLAGQPIAEADYRDSLEAVRELKLLEESNCVAEAVLMAQCFYSVLQPKDAVAFFTLISPHGYSLRQETKSAFLAQQDDTT